MEAPDELQVNTVSQHATNTNAQKPKPTFHHCKKPGLYRNQWRLLKKQSEPAGNTQNNPGYENSGSNNSIPHNNKSNSNKNKNSNRAHRNLKTVYPTSETCDKTNHFTERWYVGANAANRPFPWKIEQKRQNELQQQDS